MRRVIAAFKVTVGCGFCGYSENADALQFDHVVPVERPTDSAKTNRWRGILTGTLTWVRLWSDLLSDEIQVTCANCHAIKSAAEHRLRNGEGPF